MEVSARIGDIDGIGRAQEWCSNPFHPYPDYVRLSDTKASGSEFDGQRVTVRGASLHTQRPLRRLSFRDHLLPGERFAFTGLRLVLPPSD
jgi:iron(II)-dependent oxidoreductase